MSWGSSKISQPPLFSSSPELACCDALGPGVNGAGKTTQLQIITGALQPDSGTVLKERPNMKIAYLTQEFDVIPTRTVRVHSFPAISHCRLATPCYSLCASLLVTWG